MQLAVLSRDQDRRFAIAFQVRDDRVAHCAAEIKRPELRAFIADLLERVELAVAGSAEQLALAIAIQVNRDQVADRRLKLIRRNSLVSGPMDGQLAGHYVRRVPATQPGETGRQAGGSHLEKAAVARQAQAASALRWRTCRRRRSPSSAPCAGATAVRGGMRGREALWSGLSQRPPRRHGRRAAGRVSPVPARSAGTIAGGGDRGSATQQRAYIARAASLGVNVHNASKNRMTFCPCRLAV